MGVSGAGKTTVGKRLAECLSWNFIEGDSLHPPENVAKMKRGQPLIDADRVPWLALVADAIDGWRHFGQRGIITCSALKRRYRRQIIGDRRNVRLIYLEGTQEFIARRLAARRGHFMPPTLLDSQFATLEPPGLDENPIVVAIDQPLDEIIERISGVLLSSAESPDRVRSNLEGKS
jgi:carbohydrate kinase (thermoresistant glucokinase family)